MLASNKQQQALVKVFCQGTKLSYKKSELIIRPGETLNAVYYIESGLVKAYDVSKYGEENLLTIRKPQEVFPIIWAFTDHEAGIIYETLEPTVVWRLDRQMFLDNVLGSSDKLLPIMDIILEMYRRHSERIINLEYRSVRERIVSFLLMMSDRFGVQQGDGSVLIDVTLKQQDIASSVNASRETTSRELMSLERKSLTTTNNGKICLLNLAVLRKML